MVWNMDSTKKPRMDGPQNMAQTEQIDQDKGTDGRTDGAETEGVDSRLATDGSVDRLDGTSAPPTVLQPPLVCRVDHPDEAVSGLEVIPPVGSQGLLAPNVPDIELKSSVVQSLDIKACQHQQVSIDKPL